MAFLAEVIQMIDLFPLPVPGLHRGELTLLWKEKEGKKAANLVLPLLLPLPAEQRGYFQSAWEGLKGLLGLKQLWISPFLKSVPVPAGTWCLLCSSVGHSGCGKETLMFYFPWKQNVCSQKVSISAHSKC